MNVCLISLDFWDYDHHIIDALKQQGIYAKHIKLKNYKYKYPSFFHRLKNFFTKLFFKSNLKHLKREEYILNELNKMGAQDQILVVNPEVISIKTHKEIKKFTKKYLAYLYDSSKRNPIEHLLDKNLFDTIFSFDDDDIKTYNLQPITNYIYFKKKTTLKDSNIKYDLFTISSIDERLDKLNRIAHLLTQKNIHFNFLLVGKKKPAHINEKITFSQKKLNQQEVHSHIQESKAVLDILRKNQAGLSFRIFEAMGYQKKIITTNSHIKTYNFYNPNNILVIDANNPEIPEDFFSTPYEPIPEKIYQQYTIDFWVKKVFNLY